MIEGDGREQEHHATAAVDRVEANFELNVYDRDEDRAAILAKLVRNAMNGSPGNFGELVVDHCRIDSEREEELPPADGSDDPIYNVEQDWTIWYQEAVPTF